MEKQTIDLARYRYERAKEEIASAKILLNEKYFNKSLNSSYYAIFHCARALLVFKKLDSKKHSGLITLFSREYIRTEMLKKDLQKILTDAFNNRIESDYHDFFLASKQEAEEQIENAELFMNEIHAFIRSNYKVDL